VTSAVFKFHSVNLRAELQLALLAASEACWIYAVVLTIGTVAGAPRQVSPLGIFFVYWIALLVGRFLPRVQHAWRVLQFVTVAIALAAILIAVRVGLYGDAPLADLSWLPNYLGRTLAFFERTTAEEFSTLALIFAFLRGMSFAPRALTLWVVGFYFRLGIVIFFGAALVSALTVPVDFTVWIFVYFALSLPAIALARIEEAGQERPLGPSWALVMLTTIAATLLLGFLAAQFFTLKTINALFELLAPLDLIAQIIFTLLAVPLFFLLELAANLLAPVFDLIRNALANLQTLPIGSNPEIVRVLNVIARVVVDLVPYLRLLGVFVVVIFLGWLIARALNKRMKWEEKELYARAALEDRDGFAAAKAPPTQPARFARHEIHAENVRRIYAALLVQAEDAGMARRAAETPLEFLPRLSARFPDIAPALQAITNAYVAVHYAQQPATDAQVRELRAVWQQAREKMREAGRRR
jgi:hypothetical protein